LQDLVAAPRLGGPLVSNRVLYPTKFQILLKHSTVADVVAVPRSISHHYPAAHGKILLAGGIEAGGEFPDDIQLQIPPSSPIKTIGLSMHGTTIINN